MMALETAKTKRGLAASPRRHWAETVRARGRRVRVHERRRRARQNSRMRRVLEMEEKKLYLGIAFSILCERGKGKKEQERLESHEVRLRVK